MEYRAYMGEDTLYVQMLGGFSMTWNGVQIAGGSKVKETQFAYLMQLLLHFRKEGVSRGQLEEALFADREIIDINHSMRSVIYNAKKKLKQAGLPDLEYIRQENGRFYWNNEIAVQEDAVEFERFSKIAEKTEDPKEQLEYLLKACYSYRGEFLPLHVGVIWTIQESRRYQEIFFACVEKAVVLLRNAQDWVCMKELGAYTSRISPLENWEVITMEALVAIGDMEEARKLYDDTVDFYVRKLGFRPSKRLLELLNQLGTQMYHRYAVLNEIQTALDEQEEKSLGGYLCAWPVFQGIYTYHMKQQGIAGGEQSVYLMLCTVVDSKENPMEECAGLESLSRRLEDSICHSVRRGDAVTRYGKGQYLVLLTNTTKEDCQAVQKRINCRFLVGRQRTGVKYYVNSVISSMDKSEDRSA